MTTDDIIKHTKRMPILLSRTLNALTPDQRQAFVLAFATQVDKVNRIKANSKMLPIVRPNFTRDTERLVTGLSKPKAKWGTSLDPTLPQNWVD